MLRKTTPQRERFGTLEPLSATQRAKQVLDLCAYELKTVSVGDLITLQLAIESEINLAVKEALMPHKGPLEPEMIQGALYFGRTRKAHPKDSKP